MKKNDNEIIWTPTEKEIGAHTFEIIVTDGLATTQQQATIYVNDKPQITIKSQEISDFLDKSLLIE